MRKAYAIYDESQFDSSGFAYNAATGVITLGGVRRDYDGGPYRLVCCKNVRVLAHRLAWRLQHGEWPALQIDHRDGDEHNNRISNLRPATNGQNQCNKRPQRNCRSGERGVFWDSVNARWKFRLQHNGVKASGCASHKVSAIVAARLIRRTLHGEFAYEMRNPRTYIERRLKPINGKKAA